MKYRDKLKKSLNDDNNVAQEMLSAWIAVMLTGIFVLMLIGFLGGYFVK